MISLLVKLHYFLKNLLLYTQAKARHTENIVMMMKGESTEVVNFKPPRGRDSCAWALVYSKNAIFLLPFLFTLGHGSDKLSRCIVRMTKERSTKIV